MFIRIRVFLDKLNFMKSANRETAQTNWPEAGY